MLTYPLPRELIAKYPAEPRDCARLLVLDHSSGRLSHHLFRDLPEFLRSGDCLVLNDTKVLRARLFGRRADTGGKVELLLLDRHAIPRAADRGSGIGDREMPSSVYRCIGQPGRRLKAGVRLQFDHGSVGAEVIGWREGECWVQFEGPADGAVLEQMGEIPLPPYIDRAVEAEDADWYQTVFARHPGAVAAPTAGLHFTPELLRRMQAMGVQIAFVTLHVGWGTFKPLRQEALRSGRLHPERFRMPAETAALIAKTKQAGKRVVAVGTTVVRVLESCHLSPVTCHKTGAITDLFIRPGFQFKVVDALVTNFHLPGTSLLLLVAAFTGEEQLLAAYGEAVRQRYRFYSYGDAMLIV